MGNAKPSHPLYHMEKGRHNVVSVQAIPDGFYQVDMTITQIGRAVLYISEHLKTNRSSNTPTTCIMHNMLLSIIEYVTSTLMYRLARLQFANLPIQQLNCVQLLKQ